MMLQPSLMVIRFGQIELDEQRLMLQRDGVRLEIRPKVFDLLVHLIRHRERVVLRDELIMALWGTTAVGLGSLSGLVNELRQILGETGRGPSSIRTVHARGYQFVAEIDAREFGKSLSPGVESDTSRIGSRERRIAIGLGRFGRARSLIRASFTQVSTAGARGVIVVGLRDLGGSSLLDHASADLSHAGFEVHSLWVATRRDGHPSGLVDRLIDTLVENYGVDAIRSVIPVRACELLERVGSAESASNARPRDPLASRQYDQRVWHSTAELLRELAHQKPLALVLDNRDPTATSTTQVVSFLLRLLGKAQVFILATAGTAEMSESAMNEKSEPKIEYVRLSALDRGRLNELLEARGVAALPAALADALVAHVRDDETSLESVAGWLQAEKDTGRQASCEPALPSLERRMRRVAPNTSSRRSRHRAP